MRSTLIRSLVLPALAGFALAGLALAACDDSTAGEPPSLTSYGAPVPLGDGTARVYAEFTRGAPAEIGVALSETAFSGLPADGAAGGMPMPDGHHTYASVLRMPAQNPTPYRFVAVDWNPAGHMPPGIYDEPHFDFHFFSATEAQRDAIAPSDPEFAAIPVEQLISKAHAADLRAQIDLGRASQPSDRPGGGDTIYLCVVDGNGLCVSLIQSIFSSWGSGMVAERTGILMHNRGFSFTLDPRAANRLEPRKRPMHTLIPALLMRDGLPWIVFGTMGAHGQAQTHLQLLTNLIDFGLEPQAAIEAPRWVSGRGLAGDPANVLAIEDRVAPEVIERLRVLGHEIRILPAFSSLLGHANMIQIDRQRGVLMGASDPRSDGAALGW